MAILADPSVSPAPNGLDIRGFFRGLGRIRIFFKKKLGIGSDLGVSLSPTRPNPPFAEARVVTELEQLDSRRAQGSSTIIWARLGLEPWTSLELSELEHVKARVVSACLQPLIT